MFSRNRNASKHLPGVHRSRSRTRRNGTPLPIESFEKLRLPSRYPIFSIVCAALLAATFCSAQVKTANGMPIKGKKGGKPTSAGISVSTTRTFSSPGLMITTELGGTAEFRVVLDSQPTADVTVHLTSQKPAEGKTDVPSLTFTPINWNTTQTVIITGRAMLQEHWAGSRHLAFATANDADIATMIA